MERNYPRMFSPADDQDKDGFKLENVRTKNRLYLVFWFNLSSYNHY